MDTEGKALTKAHFLEEIRWSWERGPASAPVRRPQLVMWSLVAETWSFQTVDLKLKFCVLTHS